MLQPNVLANVTQPRSPFTSHPDPQRGPAAAPCSKNVSSSIIRGFFASSEALFTLQMFLIPEL